MEVNLGTLDEDKIQWKVEARMILSRTDCSRWSTTTFRLEDIPYL